MQYSELSKEAKETALIEYQERACGFEWWTDTYDVWIEKLERLGIYTSAPNIEFSSFYSQGAGASFIGKVELREFMEAHDSIRENHPELYLSSVGFNADPRAAFYIRLSRDNHRYSHSNTVSLEWSLTDCDKWDEEYEYMEGLMEDAEADIIGECRDYMDELYKDLERTYEHLQSEEEFLESVEANGWTFTEEGKLE